MVFVGAAADYICNSMDIIFSDERVHRQGQDSFRKGPGIAEAIVAVEIPFRVPEKMKRGFVHGCGPQATFFEAGQGMLSLTSSAHEQREAKQGTVVPLIAERG